MVTEKQWYMMTHKRIGGVVEIREIYEDDVVRYAQDYDLEPVVIISKAAHDRMGQKIDYIIALLKSKGPFKEDE